jgi:hypothetical protein
MLIAIIRNCMSRSRTKRHYCNFSRSGQKSLTTKCSGGGKINDLSFCLSYPRNEKYSKC